VYPFGVCCTEILTEQFFFSRDSPHFILPQVPNRASSTSYRFLLSVILLHSHKLDYTTWSNRVIDILKLT
jgi:hypothetical protein